MLPCSRVPEGRKLVAGSLFFCIWTGDFHPRQRACVPPGLLAGNRTRRLRTGIEANAVGANQKPLKCVQSGSGTNSAKHRVQPGGYWYLTSFPSADYCKPCASWLEERRPHKLNHAHGSSHCGCLRPGPRARFLALPAALRVYRSRLSRQLPLSTLDRMAQAP